MRLHGLLPIPLLLVSALVSAQETEPPPADRRSPTETEAPTFSDEVEVVIVSFEVTVTDRSGPVAGLTRDDFRVFQDGKPVELSNLAFYRRSSEYLPAPLTEEPLPAGGGPTVPPEERPHLELCLFVDNDNLGAANRRRVLESAAEFVRTRLAPDDRVMVVVSEGRPRVVQELTSRREDVVAALARLRSKSRPRMTAATEQRAMKAEMQRAAGLAMELLLASRERPRLQAAVEQTIQDALQSARRFAQAERDATSRATRAVRSMVTMMRALPGRKALIYLSDGLPAAPGRAALIAFESFFRQFPSASRLASEEEIKTLADFNAQSLFDNVVTAAAAAGVTIFTIDARGLLAPGGDTEATAASTNWAEEVRNYQEPLLRIAEETGGSAFVNGSDFNACLDRLASELDSYYLLGYPLPPEARGGIHTVKVVLPKCPDCLLAYRHRFVERTLLSLVEDQVLSALSFDLDENQLGITALAGVPRASKRKRWELPVHIGVPIGGLALVAEGDQLVGHVVAYYATRDTENRQSALLKAEHRVIVPKAEYESARGKLWPIKATLVVKPGSYRISVGVRDQLTGAAGFATVEVSEDDAAR